MNKSDHHYPHGATWEAFELVGWLNEKNAAVHDRIKELLARHASKEYPQYQEPEPYRREIPSGEHG